MYKTEKKALITVAALVLMSFFVMPANAVEKGAVEKKAPAVVEAEKKQADDSNIDNIDLAKYSTKAQKNIEKNAQKEVESMVMKFNKYANSHNLDGIKAMMSDSYINNDGFDKKSYLDIVAHAWELYPNLKYTAKIKDIEVSGGHARVHVVDEANGKLSNPENNLEKSGTIKTISESILYLQKYGYEWQIQSEMILDEKTILAYSDAQFLNMEFTSPTLVSEDAYYTATLKVDIPKHYVLFASINNEKISFPQEVPQEVFKTMSADGTLERVLRANDKKKNEYSVASIGITRPSVSKENKVSIKITGIAFIMSRVNVIKDKQEYTRI